MAMEGLLSHNSREQTVKPRACSLYVRTPVCLYNKTVFMFLSFQTQKLTPCTRNRLSAHSCDADFCSLPSACVRELDLAHLTRGEQLCVQACVRTHARSCTDACKRGLFSQPKSPKNQWRRLVDGEATNPTDFCLVVYCHLILSG